MQIVLGLFPHSFAHRPELASVLHRAYKWKISMAEEKAYSIPSDVRDKLLMAVLYLALSDSHLRADVPDELLATDATPSAYGSCSAACPPHVLRELWRAHRHRGFLGRLD